MKDEDLTKKPPQDSITQQVFPLIPERFLSELPEPPLIDGATSTCFALIREGGFRSTIGDGTGKVWGFHNNCRCTCRLEARRPELRGSEHTHARERVKGRARELALKLKRGPEVERVL